MKRTALINLICSLVSSVVLIVGVLLIIILRDASGIEKRKLVISSASATAIYSGEPLSDEQWYMNEGELSEGHVIEVKVTGKQTNVGISENYVSATVRDQNGADVTEKYYNIEYNPGVLNVRARSMVLIADSATKAYDGTPLTCGSYTIESSISLLPTDTLSVTISGEITEVGETKNFITRVVVLNLGNKDVTRNYSIETKDGLLTVTDASVSGDGGGSGTAKDPFTPNDSPVFSYVADTSGKILFLENVYGDYTYDGWTAKPDAENDFTSLRLTASALALSSSKRNVEITNISYDGNIRPSYPGSLESTTLSENTYGYEFYQYLYTLENYIPQHNSGNADIEQAYRSFVYQNYTALPSDSKENMLNIFTAAASDAGFDYTDADRKTLVAWVENYIRGAATYKLEFAEYPENVDVAVYFLTVAKEGICQHYATAAVCMLRALGIPARYVTGFSSESIENTDVVVTGKNAHAWCEVYIEGLGWVNIDPTGSGETSDPGTDPSPDPGTNFEPTGQVLFSVTAFSNDTLYLKLKSYGYCNGKNIVEAVEYPYTIEGVGSAYYLPALALANGGERVSVLQINPVGGIFALPYYTTTGGTVGGQSSDTTVVGSANDTYAVRYYNWDNTAGVEIPTAYQSFEEKYAAFVRENYLYVDAETKAFMQQIISDNGFSVTDTNIISKIAKYIKTAARYDETYSDKLDNEENLVIAFLSEYKSGVCRHYAQAATLLFRTLGIPARYTVGFMETVQAGTTTEITDERGHAWVEVYVDKLGWVMVEVTGTPAVGNSIKEINVSPVYTGKVYDGSTLYAIQRVNGFDALGNEGYTYEVVIEGEISELGIEKSQIVSFTIKDGFGVVVYDEITGVGKDKLKVNYSDGTVQMYISQLSFESYDYSKTYDGTPLYGVLEEIEMISGRLNSRHKCEIKLTKSITVAGKISNEYSVTVYDRSTGVDVTDYYRITKKYGTLTVEARKLTVTAASAEREYIHGTSLECKEIYYDQSLLAPGDTLVEYNVQGSQTAIGESANVVRGVVIKNSDGVNVTLSYSITIIDGVLKVTAPKQ